MGVSKKGGLLGGFDQLRAPNAPTISISPGDESLVVTFTNSSDVGGGAVSSYTATATASGVPTGATSASSPVTITGLTNGTSYSVTGLVNNAFGASTYSASTSSSPAAAIGIRFAGEGGGSGTYLDVIDKISIGSTGNATDFGDTSVARDRLSSGGNSTRGLAAGGRESSTSYVDTIEYITFASASNTTDFGDLTSARRKMASMTSSTRSIFGAGELNTFYGNVDTIDYVTTASTGDATDFGDTSEDRSNMAGFSSTTRGVMGGGFGEGASEYATAQDEIFYITMASTGNTSDFGDLLAANVELAGLADATRGVFGGGNVSGRVDVIQYVTIASTGNATDFGDLLAANKVLTGNIASSTRGIFCGGSVSGNRQNVIQYITIQSTGDATDFGDLTTTAVDHAGTASSNASVQ